MRSIKKIHLSMCALWEGFAPGKHPVLAMLIKLELLTEDFNKEEGEGGRRGVPGVLALAERFESSRRRRAERLAKYWAMIVAILEAALRGARAEAESARADTARIKAVESRAA